MTSTFRRVPPAARGSFELSRSSTSEYWAHCDSVARSSSVPGSGGSLSIVARGAAYRALEPNLGLAAELRAAGFDVRTADARAIADESGGYDLILLSHVVEHLGTYRDVQAVVTQALARLTPRGCLALLFPDVRWSPRSFPCDYTHTLLTTLPAMRKLLIDLGAECIRAGHYVGRWTRGWTPLWLAHRLWPSWWLPDEWQAALDAAFSAHAYCLARPSGASDPPTSAVTVAESERSDPIVCESDGPEGLAVPLRDT